MKSPRQILAIVTALALPAGFAYAGDVTSQSSIPGKPSFDIQQASIKRDGQHLVFRLEVADAAGARIPADGPGLQHN